MITEVLILSAVFIGTMIVLSFIIKDTDNSSPNTINIYTNNDKSIENYITEEHMKQELDKIRTEVKIDIKAQEELNRINEHIKNINKEC